ncbi:MAG TPA: alpha-amylase family glycosyl hydrolase, partial [Ferruginibacter sp.]|nr:alpha-amylase family glycosyl hydrolase [Ferruginibacter sp.]
MTEQTFNRAYWLPSTNIYEVNIRQYTPEGTFNAFSASLPRLKDMGVEVLWLMPIHPIGEKNRKGSLGSYYSIRDFKAVNPEFGTAGDFRALVKQVHNLGMKLVLDWVANHAAWDNVWTNT